MVESCAMRFQPIVAGHAVCPEGQDMFCSKRLVDLQMTISAGCLIERCGVTFDMTIFAGESCAV